MSEHKKSDVSGRTSVAVGVNPHGAILKKARVRLTAIFGTVILIIILVMVIILVHSHNNKITQNLIKAPNTPVLSTVQTQQQNLANDTDNTSKIADLVQLGAAYEAQQDYPKAVASYEQADSLDATDVRGAKHLFELYVSQKDKQNAVKYGDKTVAILTANPDSPYASQLQYYTNWLKNVQAGNFNPPKVAQSDAAS